jgi:hypothetical protein
LTPAEASARVREGALGDELAKRAKLTDNLWMAEIKQSVTALQIFHYGDSGEGINFLVEDGKIILLCSGWGTGPVSDLKMFPRGDKNICLLTRICG